MDHRRLRGPDLHSPSQELVINESGVTLNKLKVVKMGNLGTAKPYPSVSLALPAERISGIMNATVPNGKLGYMTSWGMMVKVDTSAFPAGTLLYCNASSDLSATPNNLPVARVLKQDAADGVLFVRTLGYNSADFVSATDNIVIPVAIADWVTDDAGDTWSFTLAHNLGSFYPEIIAFDDLTPDEQIGLHRVRVVDQNNTKISVCQAGVDGRFDGFIVLDK